MYNDNFEYTELVKKNVNDIKNKIKNKKYSAEKKREIILNYIHDYIDDNYFEIVESFINEYGKNRLESTIAITNTFIIDVSNYFNL